MQRLQTVLSLVLSMFVFHLFAQEGKTDRLIMYVGTYTDAGDSEGIYTYYFNQENGSAVLQGSTAAGNPSFLTLSPDGKRLYAVSEYKDGRQGAYSFDLSEDKLRLSHPVFQPTASKQLKETNILTGADPCHIYTDGKYVITANYTGGDISVFPLDAAGRIEAPSQSLVFAGFAPNRSAHIHCIIPSPDKRYILVTDLGNDRIYRFVYNPQKAQKGEDLLKKGKVIYTANENQGPRHLTFSKDGRFAYLINELGGECVVLRYRKGEMEELQRIMADEDEGRGSAGIELSPDGRFLYTSHRLKKDGISIFSVDTKRGILTKIGYQLTGIHPRYFTITPNGKYLLVACRDDNNIRVFKRDLDSGMLTDTLQTIEVDKPTCIVFAQ